MRIRNLIILFLGFFVGILNPGDFVCFAEATQLQPLTVNSIHLYVEPSAVAKADFAFSTRHFKKNPLTGEIERKGEGDVFKNRPQFKYVRGFIRINDGRKREVNWRYRGLLDEHWFRSFPFKSMKIRILDDLEDLTFETLNLNHFETDLFLHDMIAHEIHYLSSFITPRMKIVKFYVNDIYAGFKVLVENIDDHFLKKLNLPAGNIYRENTSALIGDKLESGLNYFKYWWKKKSLEKQKNWDDWIHFNHVIALRRTEVSPRLLDEEYFVRWLALGIWLPISHLGSHNVYMYHNLENQKWYTIPWDMTVAPFGPIVGHIGVDEEVLLIAPNKVYESVLVQPQNYHKRNQLAWQYLQDDSFFEQMEGAIDNIYESYLEEIAYCRNHLKDFTKSPFSLIDTQAIMDLRGNLHHLIGQRRSVLKNKFTQLPSVKIHGDKENLELKGTSKVGFKLKKNNWILEDYKNLTVIHDSDDETSFMIQVNDLSSHMLTDSMLSPKEFYLKFKKGTNNTVPGLPQIASLFTDQFFELKDAVQQDKLIAKDQKLEPVVQPKNSIFSQLKKKLSQRIAAITSKDLFSKFNNRNYLKVFFERLVFKLDQLRKRDYLEENKTIRWSGEKTLTRTTIVPYNSTLILDPGTTLKLGKKVSVIVHGGLQVNGAKDNLVRITSIKDNPRPKDYWGSICFIHSLSDDSFMKYALVEYGSEDHLMGVYCTGALSVYHVPFTLADSQFRNCKADDAVNFKYSVVQINDSLFKHNTADAIDLDFSNANVNKVVFQNNGNDGVDLGTSFAEVNSAFFLKQGDKGISVGEESRVKISRNIFINNKIAIAIKDGSQARIENNAFLDNQYAVKAYIKKKKYDPPRYKLGKNYFYSNLYDLHNPFGDVKGDARSLVPTVKDI